MIRRLCALPLVATITISACQAVSAQDLENLQMSDLLPKQIAQNYPAAPPPKMPPADHLINPAGENIYFPMRQDGQPYVLNQDLTVNFTDTLNRFYYNPRWRGEHWSPYQMYTIVEKTALTMPTWREYDEFSTIRIMNGFHKFMEKYSGYGP